MADDSAILILLFRKTYLTLVSSIKSSSYLFLGTVLVLDILTSVWLWNMVSDTSAPRFLILGFVTHFFILNILLLVGAVNALIGFITRATSDGEKRVLVRDCSVLTERHAVVMPIYEEDAVQIGARMEAIYLTIKETGKLDYFDFYILSDSVDDDKWIIEKIIWSHLTDRLDAKDKLFYRRRRKNVNRKCGNISDFIRNYGAKYETMLVLDADSIMEGSDIVRMAATMEQKEKLGILQTPPRFVRGETPFARMIQFASEAYSSDSIRGLDVWQEARGSYWGHNAMIRIKPFAECCELPILPGKPPLGGPVLSHDIVESAIMLKNGWQTQLAWDVKGSYEEFPPSIVDFLIRDRRWCQGNFQHIWFILSKDIPGIARVQLLIGILAYLAGPTWFIFLVLTTVLAFCGLSISAIFILYVGTVLFLPKILAVIPVLSFDKEQSRFGGLSAVLFSMLIENVLLALISPVIMIAHTKIVFDLLLGKVVRWDTQNRTSESVRWKDAFSMHWLAVFAGLCWMILAFIIGGSYLAWMIPIVTGLLFSVVIAVVTSSPRIGAKLRELGIFLSPLEVNEPEVLTLTRYAETDLDTTLKAVIPEGETPIHWMFKNADLNQLHRNTLEEKSFTDTALIERACSEGYSSLTREEQHQILYNSSNVEKLHLKIIFSGEEKLFSA